MERIPTPPPNAGQRRATGSAPRALAVAVLVAILGACSGTPSGGSPSVAAAPGGTITSTRFQPALTVTLPAGWELAQDSPTYLLLRPAGSDTLGIHLFRDPVAASQDASCPAQPEPGIQGTSIGLSAWLRERPGLVVSAPRLTTVGGLRGIAHDIGIAKEWTASCPFAEGIPSVPLIVATGAGGYHWVMAGGERLRLHLLDVPAGGLVAVDIDDFAGGDYESLIAQSLPILESMSFAGAGVPPASPAPSAGASSGETPAAASASPSP